MTDQEAAAGIRMVLAAVAMHALVRSMGYTGPTCLVDAQGIAEDAFALADALMASGGAIGTPPAGQGETQTAATGK